MMKRLACVVLLLAACGGEKPAETTTAATATTTTAAAAPALPTLEEAQKIVAESGPFSEFELDYAAVNVPVSLATASEEQRSVADDLKRTGWVTIENDTVAFTEKAKNDPRFNMRQNGFFDVVPLGKKQIVATKQVVPGDAGQARVFFVWQLVPNEVGKEIDLLSQRFIDENDAMATLIYDGTSWSVLKITPV